VLDFACAHRRQVVARGHLLKSLTPLYLARVASFVVETRDLVSSEVEEKIEGLCRSFEDGKSYLVTHWGGEENPARPAQLAVPQESKKTEVEV